MKRLPILGVGWGKSWISKRTNWLFLKTLILFAPQSPIKTTVWKTDKMHNVHWECLRKCCVFPAVCISLLMDTQAQAQLHTAKPPALARDGYTVMVIRHLSPTQFWPSSSFVCIQIWGLNQSPGASLSYRAQDTGCEPRQFAVQYSGWSNDGFFVSSALICTTTTTRFMNRIHGGIPLQISWLIINVYKCIKNVCFLFIWMIFIFLKAQDCLVIDIKNEIDDCFCLFQCFSSS